MGNPNPPQPDFSDVESGASSTAMPEVEAKQQMYTVVAGDNLTKIAKHFYGAGGKWKAIFEANRDTIKNPDLIRVGQVLRIPHVPGDAGK